MYKDLLLVTRCLLRATAPDTTDATRAAICTVLLGVLEDRHPGILDTAEEQLMDIKKKKTEV